ncbi:hypothetical protein IP68_03865 [Blastomonas sp. AAP25]|nr:hypothetical protein IP68_03865 [Blastomonas sp. AAP25]
MDRNVFGGFMHLLKRIIFFIFGAIIFIPAQFAFRMDKNRSSDDALLASLIIDIPAFLLMCFALWLAFAAGGKSNKKER